MSEDLSFHCRCMLADIDVWCHPGVVCGHLIAGAIGPEESAQGSVGVPVTQVPFVTLG